MGPVGAVVVVSIANPAAPLSSSSMSPAPATYCDVLRSGPPVVVHRSSENCDLLVVAAALPCAALRCPRAYTYSGSLSRAGSSSSRRRATAWRGACKRAREPAASCCHGAGPSSTTLHACYRCNHSFLFYHYYYYYSRPPAPGHPSFLLPSTPLPPAVATPFAPPPTRR